MIILLFLNIQHLPQAMRWYHAQPLCMLTANFQSHRKAGQIFMKTRLRKNTGIKDYDSFYSCSTVFSICFHCGRGFLTSKFLDSGSMIHISIDWFRFVFPKLWAKIHWTGQ